MPGSRGSSLRTSAPTAGRWQERTAVGEPQADSQEEQALHAWHGPTAYFVGGDALLCHKSSHANQPTSALEIKYCPWKHEAAGALAQSMPAGPAPNDMDEDSKLRPA